MPSSTQKPNLTGALAWSSDGNVGIGTNTPDKKLTVAGEIKTTVGLRFPDGTLQTTAASGSSGSGGTSIPSSSGMLKATGGGAATVVTGAQDLLVKWQDALTIGNSIIYDDGTKVGIGTLTPGQKLTVAGTIESTSGGFRFPDGTTQTTAQVVGPQGPAGPQGAAGATGATGPQGPAGDSGVGVGQTWQDMRSSRSPFIVTYTNTTGKPILFTVQLELTGDGTTQYTATMQVNNITIPTDPVLVPPGATYRVFYSGSTLNNWSWWELR